MPYRSNYPVYTYELIKYFPYTILLDVAHTEIHSHVFWELVYCIKGESINTINGSEHVCSRGTALLIRPQDVHTNRLNIGPYAHRDIYVSVDVMKKTCGFISEDLYDNLCNAAQTPIFALDDVQIEALENSYRLFDNVRSMSAKFDLLHELLVVRFIGLYHESMSKADQLIPRWMTELIARINKNPLDVTVSELVEMTNYSHGHICREFKNYMGTTLKNYMLKSKLSFSTSLLLNLNLSIAEISQRLGYSNQSNYVNQFKGLYNITPSYYRKTTVQHMKGCR